MKTSIKLLLPVVAATLTSLASATAPADIVVNAPSVIVKYDANTLDTRAGIRDLHSRLRIAAQSVCMQLETRVLGLREEREQCVRDAVRRSVADVGNKNLTNFHLYGVMPRVVAAN